MLPGIPRERSRERGEAKVEITILRDGSRHKLAGKMNTLLLLNLPALEQRSLDTFALDVGHGDVLRVNDEHVLGLANMPKDNEHRIS